VNPGNSCVPAATPGPVLRCPGTWLAIQLLAVIVICGACGFWQPQMFPDTQSYIAASRLPFREALVSPRTLGYPLLLRAAAALAPDYRAIPWLHFAMLAAAVGFMYFAVRRFDATRWEALAFSSGFLYAALQPPSTVAAVLTDFAGLVAAGTAVACLFWVAGARKSPAAWCTLALATAASYHIRPAYLFLAVLLPSAGSWLFWIRARRQGERFAWQWIVPGLLAAAFVPLLAYSLLRMLTVDDFGLVAFGGDTSCGLAAELLDWELVDRELPAQYRPLAAAILRERERRGMESVFEGRARVNMWRYERHFCPNIYEITIPAAKGIYGNDRVALNRDLRNYSRAVLGLRKGKCLLWAAYMLPRTAAKMLYRGWCLWLLVPLALLLAAVRRWMRRGVPTSGALRDALRISPLLAATLAVAALFYLGVVSTLILAASYADSRLVAPSAAFLPSLLLLVVLREVTLIRRIGQAKRENP
jgi:hypothetical protein